jgi:hypothetical protein
LRRLRFCCPSPCHHLGEVDHPSAAAGHVERHLRVVLDLDLDLDLVHRVLDDALAEALAGRLAGVLADQRLEQPVHRRLARRLAHRLAAAVLLEPDRLFGEVAGDLLDVAADVADFGELGRLDLDEGGIGSLASRRLISVLPQPVGPIIRMFLGVTSSRSSAPSCWRRQRLRSATATARLASVWPMMCSSSALTMALGVRESFNFMPLPRRSRESRNLVRPCASPPGSPPSRG